MLGAVAAVELAAAEVRAVTATRNARADGPTAVATGPRTWTASSRSTITGGSTPFAELQSAVAEAVVQGWPGSVLSLPRPPSSPSEPTLAGTGAFSLKERSLERTSMDGLESLAP